MYRINIRRHTLRDRKNQRNADNADTARKRYQCRSSLLGKKIFQRKVEGCTKRHRGLFSVFFLFLGGILLFACLGYLIFAQRCCIARYLAIQHSYNSSRILFGKLGIVRNHNDQTILGNALEYLHNLNTGFGIKRTRRLICKNNIGIVHKSACDCHSLHLSARHFGGLFIQLRSESNLFKCFLRTLSALGLGNTRKRQRKLYVLQYRLMWNQIIALKDKSYRMISISIPISVLKFFR